MDTRKGKKKPELIDQLFVGNIIDAYHVGGKQYRLAYILSRNDKEIEVTYDGLSKKENETFKLQSNKLYFARRFTNSYTGDDYKGGKTSREYLKFSNEDCQKYIKELKDIQTNNFQNMSAIDICQSIRVRQFLWLDMVLSTEFSQIQLPIALEYIKQQFNFIKWYFEQFPKYYSDYIRGQQNPDLYLIDERVSISLCFLEVTEGFCMLFGSIWRVLKPENSIFYQNFEQLLPLVDKMFTAPIYSGFTPTPQIADWKLYNGATDLVKCIKKTWPFYCKIMSYFRQIGGFTAWEGLLKTYEGEYSQLPLKILHKYSQTQQYLASYFPLQEQANIAKKLLDWILKRVNNLSVQDIKDTDVDTIKESVNDMNYLFLKAYSQEQLNHWTDEVQLLLAQKFLTSTFLEKRVKGISEIKDFTERINATDRVRMEPQMQFKNKITITKDELVKWIKDFKILELGLLGDSVHPELIKRSSEIAIFLCKNNAFQNSMIDEIWLQNYDKHETTQVALYDFFKILSSHLNFEGIEKLYSHICNIPYNKYNENVVGMIRTFTEAALSSKFHQLQINLPAEKRFMTFNQLWMLLQDREDQIVPSHIQELCFSSARHLVSNIQQTKQFLQMYFGKCFELIGSHTSVYQAISFVHYMLDKQFRDDQNGKKQLIRSIDQKYNIVELFVKDIEVYMEKVRAYFKDEAPTDIILWGVQKFQQNIFFRLQMLNYLLSQSELRINYEQIVRLWDTLCAKTKGSIQKKEFYKIITIPQMDQYSIAINQNYFDRETQVKFFQQVLCNPKINNYSNYSQEDFDLFLVFFKHFNSAKQTLRYFSGSSRILVLDLNIEGKQAIWDIFVKVTDINLLEQVQNLLITLHTSLSSQIAQKADKLQQELMEKCLEFIQQSNPSLTSRSINLLVQLFETFQNGPPSSKKIPKSNNYFTFKAMLIQGTNGTNGPNDQKLQEFKETDSTTLHQWKQKLAEEQKVAYKQLDIYLDNRPLESAHDATEITLSSVFLPYSSIKVTINKKFHPKNYLSQDSRTFEILFKLLAKQDSIEFSTQVWDLINKLPVNVEVKQNVLNCKEWKVFLDHQFFDMFYVLQIIQKQLENEQWCKSFVTSDGVDLVTQKFLGLPLDFINCPLEKKCCLTYLEVLNHPSIKINEEQILQQIKKKMLQIIYNLAQDLIAKKHPTSTTEPKLLKICFLLLGEDSSKLYIRDPYLPTSLITFFIDHDNIELKKEYANQLMNLKHTPEAQLITRAIFESVLEIVVDQNKQKSEHFFEFTCEILKQAQFTLNPEEQLNWIITKLKSLPYNEVTLKDQDQILIGLLKILNVFLEKFQHLRSTPGLFTEILSYVFENDGEIRCKCKSTQSRTAAFNCLLTMLQHNLETYLNLVAPLHATPTWRTRHQSDWNIQSKFHEKSSTGFVGLYNLGCICYMNSLLQQLFMVPQFRESLMQIQEKHEGPEEENLIHQLKCLFLALKHSQKQYHNPKKLCHAFKDIEGNPTNIFEQMDVDEFCNLLMDRIELCIKGTPEEDLVKRHFGGVMSNEIICKTCPHYSEREEPFFAVSLPVANKKNLDECLQTLVQGDFLEGENAYHCELCNKKVNALKRMCLKKLPNHLILVLKRFNFDFDLMAKAKLNDRIEFPFELDLEQFSQQGLRKQESRDLDQEEMPSEYFQYRLSGVVIHLGSADSGHYYSFIQDRKDMQKWYEFNDIFVSSADMKDIINDGFGGVDKMTRVKYAPQFKDKSKSAYMLFYERIKQTTDQMEIEQTQLTTEITQFLDEIKDENRKFQIQRLIFSPEYFIFMQNMIKWQLNLVEHNVVKSLVYFYLTCAVRENDKSFITHNIVDLCQLLRKSIPTCEWLLQCFSVGTYIREFQLECSKRVVRKYVITLIATAMETVTDDGYCQQVIISWTGMIVDLKKSLRNSAEFYDLFYRFARIKKVNAEFLLKQKIVGRLLDLYIDIVQINSKQCKLSQEEIRKLDSTVLVATDLDKFLGSQNNTDAASHYYDDLLEKKFEKSLNFGPSISRVYLWRTIAYLLKTYGKQQFSIEEQNLLNFDQGFVTALLEEGDCKLSIRMISDILNCLVNENIKMSDMVMTAVIKQVNDKEYKEYRKYLVILKRLFTIKDTYQIQRINGGMTKLLESMFKQSQYFFETDICQQYILRMGLRNQQVHSWMIKNQKLWSWIIDNIQKSQVPNDKLIANNSNPSKCLHRLHNIYLPTSGSGYQNFISWKRQQFISLIKEPFANNQEFDSDDDLTDKLITQDDKIDYYYSEQHQWISATVSRVMADYLHLTFNTRNSPLNLDIEIDSEKLAPFNTLSANNRIPGFQQEIQVEKSDHDNDTEEGNHGSLGQTDSDD